MNLIQIYLDEKCNDPITIYNSNIIKKMKFPTI